MSSIFSKIASIFSSGDKGAAAPSATQSEEYQGLMIFAEPIKEGGQYRLAGRIEKRGDGGTLVRSFIRADLFSSSDEAIEFTLRKGRQIIDQNGKHLFADAEGSRPV
ncbi:HlyU family transcriptional regulator [Rhizobium sp. PAMB 3182]